MIPIQAHLNTVLPDWEFSLYGIMLILMLFSLFFYIKKTASKLTLHRIGNFSISYLTEIKFEILRVTFFKMFFTTEKLWDGHPVFWK